MNGHFKASGGDLRWSHIFRPILNKDFRRHDIRIFAEAAGPYRHSVTREVVRRIAKKARGAVEGG
jgi:hypothetical protein